ncbi:MAG: glycoside hydrolase family 57 protein [Candidatus Saccharimonadales bacterium]
MSEPKRAVVLYLLMHQPYRVSPYNVFDIANRHSYFTGAVDGDKRNNEFIFRKVAEKSYRPTLTMFEELTHKHPQFKISLSISGTLLEQMEQWGPDIIDIIRRLVKSGNCEIVGENYHHSLAFFYSRAEFEMQVGMHRQRMEAVFGVTPTAYRNTEMSYNNDLAYWADKQGYKVILSEGWDPILGWRSPNFVYRPTYTNSIRLLTKNYKLSDDLAFRFGNRDWEGWPLTAEKFVGWANSTPDQPLLNLFMDFETIGEHQWADTGIFDFMRALPSEWLQDETHDFMTVTEAATYFDAVDYVDTPQTITWADTERDLTAWLGNDMQTNAISALYGLQDEIIASGDLQLIDDWRRLQTSDHFYYMCTKWFSDGDVHAYFSPYDTPYEAFITFMNTYHDLKFRLSEKGIMR